MYCLDTVNIISLRYIKTDFSYHDQLQHPPVRHRFPRAEGSRDVSNAYGQLMD